MSPPAPAAAPPGTGRTGGRLAVAAAVIRRLVGAPMTWEAYRFDTTKAARHARVTPALERMRCPSEPGLVSVVLPTHNGARYLAEALDSIRDQTYTRLELIVVDDGSTDATPDVLAAYAARDPRIRVLRQPNRRLPAALSAGLRVARGEFLTWTSDDNRLRPDFLARMVDCLRRHPRWDMVYSDVDLIDGEGATLTGSSWYWNYQTPPGSAHVALPDDPSELNVRPNNHVGAAFLYRDRVDVLLGDYSPIRFGTEDYDYWMQINLLLTLRHADFRDALYEYRFHSRSLTAHDERLGITRSRTALMVFDDFRRDFALVPLALVVRPGVSETARHGAEALVRAATAAGALHMDPGSWSVREAPRLWWPGVDVTVVDGVDGPAGAPSDCAPHALRVLLAVGDAALPADPGPDWDLCLATSPTIQPTRTVHPRQGWCVVPDPQALYAVIDIRARAHHARRLEAELAAPPPPSRKVSVVVCTLRRHAALERCLVSLATQRMAPDDFEVLVVSNDPSDDATRELVASLRHGRFADSRDRLRLLPCPFPGLSFARNAGIAESRGTVVCFIDDDAVADPDWLVELWRVYATHPDAGVVGGTIRLRTPSPRPRVAPPGLEKLWSAYRPGEDTTHEVREPSRFPYGANWSARRGDLCAIGGFRSGYGRTGRDFGGGEEIVAAALVRALGHRVLVAPRAQVVHAPDPARFSLRHVWRTILGANVNWYRQQCDGYVPRDLGLHRALRWPARDLKRALRPGISLPERVELTLQTASSMVNTTLFARDVVRRLRRPFVRRF